MKNFFKFSLLLSVFFLFFSCSENKTKNKIAIKVATVSKICKEEIRIDPNFIGQSKKYIEVTAIGRGDTSNRNKFCKIRLTPKAVSSPVVASAYLTGLKAILSKKTAIITEAKIAPTIMIMGFLNAIAAITIIEYPPIAITSPCAKFTNPIIENTIAKPNAINAYSAPKLKAFNDC